MGVSNLTIYFIKYQLQHLSLTLKALFESNAMKQQADSTNLKLKMHIESAHINV